MFNTANALKLLGDETRLRILRLVAREPLNVSELTSILGLAQSGISRHLGLLRQTGLLEERREGVWSYYQVSAASSIPALAEGDGSPMAPAGAGGDAAERGGDTADPEILEVWNFVKSRFGSLGDPNHDLVRLAEVLRQRENYGGGLNEKLLEPGQSWFAWSRALHFLLPSLKAIDLGCGDGAITVEIGRFARSVVGIDANPRAIQAARRRAEREHLDNVIFKEDRIESLAEPDGEYDLAVFSQSLHHVADVEGGLAQAVRVLRPGGRLILVDLAPHRERWVIEKLGHVHLGFAPERLEALLKGAGLEGVQLEQVHQRRGEAFTVIVASGLAPGG
ncbi:MAG: metalloregulator ArsR/SmtB family transcription factor [SAR324 cluster bacterium]|nr:metalloregulator ArsR/SmtB family transcription factor [SAR324 cluster bacterium]